ncbi:MAG: twin-arginine translocase subunit TatB [Gammaproteobacteria bacterium]|nr:MAG: twin-arginine translocase subunit TatB [Gammaproteobacteria bacterium]TDJ49893.1 MAG: twin-arginine translocase subunit TatB [Gemmatimonadota bacterium]
MFDVGFPELILVSVIALLVLGPERLPEALRTMGLWLGRLRRSFNTVKAEIEREIGMDEIRRQLHNEAVLADIKRIEDEVRATGEDAKRIDPQHGDAAARANPDPPEPHQPSRPEPDTSAADPSEPR